MHKADAFRILAEFHMMYRIAEEDGRTYKMSDSFKADRVNLFIENNIVAGYRFY